MKEINKYICVLLALTFCLCGCSAKTDENGSGEEKPLWEAEQEYKEIDGFSSAENISMDNLLVACVVKDFEHFSGAVEPPEKCYGNNRYCLVFKDGYVYCANLYCEYEPNGVGFGSASANSTTQDNVWDRLKDVYCIGRVSSEDIYNIENWIDQLAYVDHAELKKWEPLTGDMKSIERVMKVFREDFPEQGLKIWNPGYKWISDDLEQDGMEYYDDPFARQIIQWFIDSPYYSLWNQHMRTTGQEVWNSF